MKNYQELYQGLEDMSVKGGSLIGVVSAEALLAYLREKKSSDPNFQKEAVAFGEQLKSLKPTMATVHNVVDEMLELLKANDITVALKKMEILVEAYKKESENALADAAINLANVIQDGDVLLTHSYTKSVLGGLEIAHQNGKKFSVISGESRPLKEGAYLASLLSKMGIPSTVITDASVAFFMPKVSKVLVGADALYSDGTVVNKMGTLGVSILADRFMKPVYAVSITQKLYPKSFWGKRLELESRPASEVMDCSRLDEASKKNLSVINIFFEETPPALISYIITEKGVVHPSQLWDLTQKNRGVN